MTTALLIQPVWKVSSDAILVTSFEDNPTKRTIVYANAAFAALTGFDAADVVGKPASICDGPKTNHASLKAAEVLLRADEAHKCTIIKYRRDRSEYYYTQILAPVMSAGGKATHLIESGHMTYAPPANTNSAKHELHVGLAMPMPLMHFGKTPQHLKSTPETDALRTLWDHLRVQKKIPLRSAFTPAILKRWNGHLSIADVLPGGQFQFSDFGTNLADVYGQDLTGRMLDELPPSDIWNVVLQHYRAVVETKAPLFCPISVSNGSWYTEVSRMLLPLSNDGESVAFILGADYSRTAKVIL